MKTKIVILGIVTYLLLFSFGCKKEDLFSVSEQNAIENVNEKSLTVTYGVTPSIGTYTANSSGNLSGGCGTFTGGTIRAKVTSVNGSQITILIGKSDGSTFTTSGTAKVMAASVCGGLAGTVSYSSGVSSVNVTINATFSQGITHFYPVVFSSNGLKYYSEPILVYTNPIYTTSTTFGTLLGTVDGVEVRYNPLGYVSNINNTYNGTTTGMKWQCVELVNRYYLQVYGMDIRISGTNAYQYYGTASQRGLVAKSNGGTTAPRVGDVLCFSGGSGGLGHVMIISEVSSNQVKVAHQNGGSSLAPIGCSFTRNGNTITAWTNYTCQGWCRKP